VVVISSNECLQNNKKKVNKNERTFIERAHDTPHLPTDTGDNIFMKYNYIPLLKSYPLVADFSEKQSYPRLIPSMFLLFLTTLQSFVSINQQMKELYR
jgi:hypothetical protein